MEADLLIKARWIVPVDPEGQVLEAHALAVRDGVIVHILPNAEADLRWRAREVLSLDRHVLIPGLINAHTHAAMALFRGLADDLPLIDWLTRHIWPAEQRWVADEFVRAGTRLATAEMLRSGTTCFNDMYFFPNRVAELAAEAGTRVVAGLILIDFPTPWATDADEYLSKGLGVHDAFHAHPLIHFAFAPHAPYTVSDAPLERIGTLAEELDLPIHMHVHETAHEVDKAIEATGERPLARLARLGLLSPRLIAVHMTQMTATDIGQCAQHGVNIVHCPRSNLKLASGFCPIHALRQAGINVALGTDGAASNNSLDMLSELSTAALLAKGVAEDPCAAPAGSALRMATLNGAQALGIDTITGSLTIGKQADIAAIDLGGIETQPVYDPISALVYAVNREAVTDVWVAGRRLLRNRELLTLDEAAILREAELWRARIQASRDKSGSSSP